MFSNTTRPFALSSAKFWTSGVDIYRVVGMQRLSVLSKLSNLALHNQLRLNVRGLSSSGSSSSSGVAKTMVMLRDLPYSTTGSKLSSVLSDIELKKVELEPGCMVHFGDDASADYASVMLKEKLGVTSIIRKSSLPSVLVSSSKGSDSGSTSAIFDKMNRLNPLAVFPIGSSSVQFAETSASSALTTAAALRSKSINARITRQSEGTYVVEAALCSSSDSDTIKGINGGSSRTLSALPTNVSTRLVTTNTSTINNLGANVQTALDVFASATSGVNSAKLVSLKKPTLLVRITGGHDRKRDSKVNDELASQLKKSGATSVHTIMRSKDVPVGLVVAHFPSENVASAAAKTINGKTSVSYIESFEHSIAVGGIPDGTAIADIKNMFNELTKSASIIPCRVEFLPTTGEVAVVYSGLEDARIAFAASNKHLRSGALNINKQPLSIRMHELLDPAVDITIDNDAVLDKTKTDELTKAISKALDGAGLQSKVTNSRVGLNHTVLLTFKTRAEANAARSAVLADEDHIHATIYDHPTKSLEIMNLSTETPADEILTILNQDSLAPSVISLSRSGMVQFKKRGDVVPGIKKMKSKEIDGMKLKPKVIEDGVNVGTSVYDEDGDSEHFDKFALERLLQDFMDVDPATRYQIARNAFERALADAKALKDVKYLLETNAPQQIKDRANQLLNVRDPKDLDVDGLFELYIQRDDVRRFTHDFQEMRAVLGVEDSSDAFDWSQFQIEVPGDVEKLARQYRHDLAKFEDSQQHLGFPDILKSYVNNASSYLTPDQAKEEDAQIDFLLAKKEGVILTDSEIVVSGENGKERISLKNDPSSISDADGFSWSGVVLDSDTVQKTMAGGRVISFRCLVMVGNLRGTGGFGVGKAKSYPDAMNAAFRDALRNLTHIDLYENASLAHDLYGKHNSCRVYIKGTPTTRDMVGSKLANSILNRMGIASASTKIVGRRNPYAQVRAIFNALETHENIDEFARARGKRYVTLKWAHDNKI